MFKARLIVYGVVLAIVAVIIGGVILVAAISEQMRQHSLHVAAAAFDPFMDSYMAKPKDEAPADESRPPVKKLVVVDVNARTLDPIWFDIPADLRASGPADVGTVVWVEWGVRESVAYEYKGGDTAYVQTAKVTVIDKDTQTVIASKDDFLGEFSPANEVNDAKKPKAEVVAYVKSLPNQ